MSIDKELMIMIWCLGNLESLRSVADRFGITKATGWDDLYRTARLLLQVQQAYKIIQWPNQERQMVISNYFNNHHFSGIIGCIQITAPKINRNSYINRNGYHSLLLQGFCDYKKLFTNVYTGEVGSLHNYTLYKRSELYAGIENGQVIFHGDKYLVGDLAYK